MGRPAGAGSDGMRRVRNATLAVVCLIQLAMAQRVEHQYDKGTAFSKFRTYDWVATDGSSGINRITAVNIMNLVNTQLAKKGLVAPRHNQIPDLYVGFQTEADPGTLIIDIYRPTERKLIWRGTATNTLNLGSNADKNYNNLHRTIEKLMKPFPPPGKK
jgi:hypothetical protein